ncbi:Crp/Fnr family transcriptional regulator [Pseudoflavitalea rhizosphaerae]|uniref:Crp/Fnr family transcriptional regulator n=1 Tax=Pseudoflavitalea rhizosphaerae TaxID=1884793 RepID=UPI000F8E1A83|nr:Crp/Fnr family transcriptional regulator [Pseudoflavitalea rhizosphaerae]
MSFNAAAKEILQEFLQKLTGLSAEETAPLFSTTRHVQLTNNQVYIPIGDKSRKLAFIEKGVMRAYAVKENGDEATLYIRWEGQFIASHDTIINYQPSRFIYRALEDCTLMEIDYDTLDQIMREQPKFEPLRNFFLMRMLSETLDMIESFVFLSPEERYQKLITDRFNIVNRVPDKHLASMLGVTPVSLSRIRKRIQQQKKIN